MKKRVAIVLTLLSLFVLEAKAYDFAIKMRNGDSLFLKVISSSEHTVSVVPPNEGGGNYYLGHVQPSGTLAIPSTVVYEGVTYTVVAIGERAFSGCAAITAVGIPPTVETIGDYAFYGCTGIKGTLLIGNNIRSIGNSAFYACINLSEVQFSAMDCSFMGGSMSTTVFGNCRSLRRVVIGNNVKRIPNYAFCGVDAIRDTIALPNSLEHIGAFAFAYCSLMPGNLVIPNGVKSIGECAFHQCHALRSLTLGTAIDTIGTRAFNHCIGLRRVTVKTITPPGIHSTTFAELPKTAIVSVPCVSKNLYQKHPIWGKFPSLGSYGPCSLRVEASPDNAAAGSILGGGNYKYGDSAMLTFICAKGYAFNGWSDGIIDNPRRIYVNDNLIVKAITQPSGTIVIRDTLFSVDTVYADGVKTVYDTIDIQDVALSINDVKEISFNPLKKRLKWHFPKREKLVSVSVYNQVGECIYTGNGRKGHLKLRRYPAGTYLVRFETTRRIIRCRLFTNADDSRP